jgi:electron transfer flavoprotein alpha/beta subunit
MNIGVFIKQVPAEGSLTTHADHTLVREGVANTINPPDLNALEEALRIKDATGSRVTVVTMGPASAAGLLRQAASMGADRLCLVSDPVFAGSDTFATAKTLSLAVRHLNGFDLLLCGRRSIDGETGQVGPELAALLNIPCATNCVSLRVAGQHIFCRRLLEKEYQEWRLPLPALVTVNYGINSPRLPSIAGLRYAKDMPIETLTARSFGLSADECGLTGSPTRVVHVTIKPFGKRSGVRKTGLEGLELALAIIHEFDREG